MPARECAATQHGLELIAQGMSVRAAAKAAGVAPSTLTRALKRRTPTGQKG